MSSAVRQRWELLLSRLRQWSFRKKIFQAHGSRTSLSEMEEFKYLRAVFINNGKKEAELDARNVDTDRVMHSFQYGILGTWVISKKNVKFSIVGSMFMLILNYGCKYWMITEITQKQIQGAKVCICVCVAGCFWIFSGVILLNKMLARRQNSFSRLSCYFILRVHHFGTMDKWWACRWKKNHKTNSSNRWGKIIGYFPWNWT